MLDMPTSSRALGAQLWVDPEDDPERIAALVASAVAVGIGQLRIFLMWPWIEAARQTYDFYLYDDIFDACDRAGVGVKATLTANSGPWWLGTPDVLHSHTPTLDSSYRPAMHEYVTACVRRYRQRASLAQWIPWNEPQYPAAGYEPGWLRTDEQRPLWAAALRERFDGDIERMNARLRTGFETFEEAPFAEDIAHPLHRDSQWRSYGPVLADYALRAKALSSELSWLAAVVRENDESTPVCINPNLMLDNHAAAGYDLGALAATVDVLGASFHAPWHFSFAERDTHIPLIVAGTSLLANTPGAHGVEVTEVQFGNTYLAGRTPLGVSAGQITSTILAPLLAGASSVTGWCLNTRRHDFEAGEWGLLDDDDKPSARAEGVSAARDALAELEAAIGPWSPAPNDAWVITSEHSQAVQWAQSANESFMKGGRSAHEAAQGSALLTAELLRLGIAAGQAPASALAVDAGVPAVMVVSHLTAWDEELAARLVTLTREGRVLLMDGTCGQYDLDASLHRPWPAGVGTALGFRNRGLITQHDGSGRWPVTLFGADAGYLPSIRSDLTFEEFSGWEPVDQLRIVDRQCSPVLWSRPLGEGRVFLMTGSLAATARVGSPSRPVTSFILDLATQSRPRPVRPLSDKTITLRVCGRRGSGIGVFAEDSFARKGADLRVRVPAAPYTELLSGERYDVLPGADLILPAPAGVALLVSNG